MRTIIDSESNRDYNIDHGDTVERDIPERKEPEQEKVDQDNTKQHKQCNCNISSDSKHNKEHSNQRQRHILNCLYVENNIALVVEVGLVKRKGVCRPFISDVSDLVE